MEKARTGSDPEIRELNYTFTLIRLILAHASHKNILSSIKRCAICRAGAQRSQAYENFTKLNRKRLAAAAGVGGIWILKNETFAVKTAFVIQLNAF